MAINKGLDGQAIDMQNESGTTTTYEKGLTAHANSEVIYDISNLKATMFTSWVGAEHSTNNSTPTVTSIQFFVYADNALVGESPVLGYYDPAVFIKVPIPAGTKKLKLVTDGCGSNTGDHSSWGTPQLVTDPDALKEFNTMNLSSEKNAYLKGTTVQLQYSFKDIAGDDLVPDSYKFESSNPEVASVDEKTGVVTSKKMGTVRFTLTATKGTITKTQTIVISFMDEVTPQHFSLTSPDGNLIVNVDYTDEGSVSYSVSDKSGQVVVGTSTIGINTEYCDFSNALTYKSKSGVIEHNDSYTTISGKRSEVTNHYNEEILSFTKDAYFFDIYLRAYDEGFAYRFAIRRQDGKEEKLNVVEETGTFKIPAKSSMYAELIDTVNSKFCYESGYSNFNVNDKKSSFVCFPTLVRLANNEEKTDKYLLLNESNLYTDSYAGSLLKPVAPGSGEYQIYFAPVKDDVVITTSFTSPWRYGIFGEIGDVVESDLTEKLADATDEDFSWVVPGVTAWMWLSEGYQGQRTEATIRKYIDLAAEMGWKYLILDEGWQPNSSVPGKRYDGYFPYFDELVEYADSKGVGFIAWVLNADLDTPEELDILNEWAAKGIKGIKADFFDNESQETIDNYKRIYERCAELKLVVNCHGANKPTGERRTYPNVFNREAVNGEEYGGFWVDAAMYWAYARNVVGPIDITPRLYPTASGNTVGVQLACNIIFESGMPCMASGADDYLNFNAKLFYKNLPAAWDDIHFIDGSVGSWVSLARRSGDNWYAASMSVVKKTNLQMKLDFLGEGKYYAIIYKDADSKTVEVESKLVTSADTLTYDLLARGGYSVKFIKANNDGKYIPSAIVPDKTEINTIVGIRQTLNYKLEGTDILFDTVKFTSSDSEVVSVSQNGDILPLKSGKATITIASLADEKICTKIEINVSASPFVQNNLFTLKAQQNSNALSFVLDDVNKVQLLTSLGSIKDGDVNELVYNLPKGNFKVKVSIDDYAQNTSVGGGVVIHLGEDKYIAVQRTYTDQYAITCIGQGVKTEEIKDFLAGDKNKPYTVTVELKDGELKVIGGFTDNNTRTFATVKVADSADLSVGLFANTSSDEEVQAYTFSNFTIDDQVVPFAINTDPTPEDPSKEESDQPSVSSKVEEPSDSAPAPASSPDKGENDDEPKEFPTGAVVAGVAAVLVIAGIAVALVLMKKKK